MVDDQFNEDESTDDKSLSNHCQDKSRNQRIDDAL